MTTTDQRRSISRATTTDRAAASQVLASAFLDDPVFEWLLPRRAARSEVLAPMFELYLTAFARHDETHVVRVHDIAGVAMLAPPGEVPVLPQDEETLVDGVIGLVGDAWPRFEACIERFEAVHPADPAWYLQFLGVAAAHQGLGLGSTLLGDLVERADRAGEAVYLEATSERNRALYERHGFTCTGEIVLPDGPTAYPMWRDPTG